MDKIMLFFALCVLVAAGYYVEQKSAGGDVPPACVQCD